MPILNQGSLGEITIVDSSGTAISIIDPGDGVTEPSSELAVGAQQYLFNGSTLDRARSGGSSGSLLGAQKMFLTDSVTWQKDYDAGNEKSFTVPSSKLWMLRGAFVRVVCDGTAGNRELQITLNDDAENVGNIVHSIAMTASNTYFWHLTPYLNQTAFNADLRIFGGFFPNLTMEEGDVLKVLDLNDVSSSDTWSVTLFVNQVDE